MKEVKISKVIPEDGVVLQAAQGRRFTRIHLDLAEDGITLAMVGAASAALLPEKRHFITLKPTKDGITLAMVGAASAPK